jgi:hypothetical protein
MPLVGRPPSWCDHLDSHVPKEASMKAAVGDRITVRGHRVGEPNRDAEIIEVRGDDGAPPYVVRWDENGHETLFFPGTDAFVKHYEAGTAAAS